MKSTTQRYSVWSDGLLYAHTITHLQHVVDIVIWYDKCVWYHTNCSCSITCQKWDNSENLGQLCQPFIQRTQINCVQVSGSLRQMDVVDKCLWSTIRLGWLPRESKLHVMLLLCMCWNHTHLCTALRIHQLI